MLLSKLLISFPESRNDLSQSMGCSACPPVCSPVQELWCDTLKEGIDKVVKKWTAFPLGLILQSKANSILKIHARANNSLLNP